MNVSRALSEKNRLARKIKDIQSRINEHNSYIKGNSPVYDIEEQLDELKQTIESLIEIKVKITHRNLQVIEDVYRLSELKSLASFLKKLPIKEGKVKEDRYSSEIYDWVSEIGNRDRDKIIEELESQIITLQLKMDKFNFETEL